MFWSEDVWIGYLLVLEETLQSQLWKEKKHQQKTTLQFINEFITHWLKQGKEETTTLKMGKENGNGKEETWEKMKMERKMEKSHNIMEN